MTRTTANPASSELRNACLPGHFMTLTVTLSWPRLSTDSCLITCSFCSWASRIRSSAWSASGGQQLQSTKICCEKAEEARKNRSGGPCSGISSISPLDNWCLALHGGLHGLLSHGYNEATNHRKAFNGTNRLQTAPNSEMLTRWLSWTACRHSLKQRDLRGLRT